LLGCNPAKPRKLGFQAWVAPQSFLGKRLDSLGLGLVASANCLNQSTHFISTDFCEKGG
jgi:hypothetical protein